MKDKYVIPGPPIAWQRPRFNGSTIYDGQKNEKHSTGIYFKFLKKHDIIFKGPIKMTFTFYIKNSKKKGLTTSRPDVDNMVKFYMDVATGILYEDDKQVVIIEARKVYAETGSTEIIIEEIE